jgi:hypothetical protein
MRDRGLVLHDQRLLSIDALAGGELLDDERAEALEVKLGVGEQRFVARLVGSA